MSYHIHKFNNIQFGLMTLYIQKILLFSKNGIILIYQFLMDIIQNIIF